MPIEVDQSCKVERTEKDTILAFSDGQSGAIIIPARVKRQAFKRLRSLGKEPLIAGLMVFAAGVIILLRDYLKQRDKTGETIFIDIEYSGQEAKIRGILLQDAHKIGLALKAERIVFHPVGKKSNAHKLAWGIQRGKGVAGYTVTPEDLEDFL